MFVISFRIYFRAGYSPSQALSMVSELQVLSLGWEQRCFRRWLEMSSAQIGAHERAEDLKRSMIENMPPKGVIFSGFIRTFAILCFVPIENLFVFFMATLRQVIF